MTYELEEARKKVIEAGLRLTSEQLIVRTWGNISARVSDTQFVITPSGKAYNTLSPEDIVLVNIDKCTYEGELKPSSECGIHADVYATRPDVDFVIHTHQIYASAVSITGTAVDVPEDSQELLGAAIPCGEYGMSASEALRKKVRKCMKKNTDCKAMLLKNHGILCLGTDMDNSFAIAEAVEKLCQEKYIILTDNYDSIREQSDREGLETWDEIPATRKDLKADGFVDYGSSHCEGDIITLTVRGKEYKYRIKEERPMGRMPGRRSLNKIARLHASIYENRYVNYIEQCTLPNVVEVSNSGMSFRPYIDDQAQIIGEKAVLVGKKTKKLHFESSREILRGLKDNTAVFIAGQGALITAGNKEDLEAAALVLEKGCVAAKLAFCQPECEPVPKKSAKKERDFYLNHYSKLK